MGGEGLGLGRGGASPWLVFGGAECARIRVYS